MVQPPFLSWHASFEQVFERDRILETLLLGQGFQLLLVVCDAPQYAATFRTSLANGFLEKMGKPWHHEIINPYAKPGRDPLGPLTQAALVDEVLERLVYPSASPLPNFCLVIDGCFFHSSGAEAWTWLFRRMNERRNIIVANHKHSLMLFLSSSLFKLFAREAPDFWSIQTAFVNLPELKTLEQIAPCPDATSLLQVQWPIWVEEDLTIPEDSLLSEPHEKETTSRRIAEAWFHYLKRHEQAARSERL